MVPVPLESCALFRQLPPGELAELAAGAALRPLSPGQTLFREGDPGDGIYVVRSGQITLSARVSPEASAGTSSSPGEPRPFSEVGAGDFFGEMSVLDQRPRSATATAGDAGSEVYFIPRERLVALLAKSPGVNMALLQEISRRMREFNQQYFREVLQAERMALIGRFASAIVHDLKNPLTIIGLTAELACLDTTPPESRRAAEERIQRQIQRITGMVNDILDFTRGPGSESILILADYGRLLQSVLDELRPEVTRKSVALQLDGTPPDLRLRLHPQRLTRVLYNLIFNAVDEMPDGGTITVRLHPGPDTVTTEIADTGRGIAPEIIDRLFEPFASHGKTKGTGLGLSISRRILEEHGGTIHARNHPDGGAVFTFTLPLPRTE